MSGRPQFDGKVKTWPWPPIDPHKNQVIKIVGRKGSGKSEAAKMIFRGWPDATRIVVDPSGDADPGADLNPIPIPNPVPATLPRRDENEPFKVYRWIPDTKSDDYKDELDRVFNLGLYPKDDRVVMWVDEDGEVFPANAIGPARRTAVQQGRHHGLSLIKAGPRVVGLETLCLAQSDRVLMFDTPSVHDRKRLAGTLGIKQSTLEKELDENRRRGPHWYLMYIAEEHRLYRCPPLPL